MAQCIARRANGARCASAVKPPSTNLCGLHRMVLAHGSVVIDAVTRRRLAPWEVTVTVPESSAADLSPGPPSLTPNTAIDQLTV